MVEAPVRIITPGEAEQLIDDVRSGAARACALFGRGLLSEAGLYSRVSDLVLSLPQRFFQEKNLRLRIAPRDWPVFTAAADAWRQDGDEGHLRACSWLIFPDNDESRGIRFGDEACVSDKARVLGILDACRIPAGAFRPVPEGIPCPDEYPGHFPNEYVVGFGIWEQDAGLVSGDCRIGEEKILVDRRGLKTVIRVEEYTPEDRLSRYHDSACAGTGTVEGYTSARPRKIRIYLDYRRKRIDRLKFLKENDDYSLDFPLWKRYREDRAEIREICSRAVRDIIEEYGRIPE